MSEEIELYSFSDADRSGKVRWTAAELGINVKEHRVAPGSHFQPPYTDLNPLAQIPTVRFRDQTLLESTAICQVLMDSIPGNTLVVERGENGRQEYLFWVALFTESFEGRLVECAVSKLGIIGPEYFELHEAMLRRKLAAIAPKIPATGYLCGDRFSFADICAGYSLRLALQCELIENEAVESYFGRLKARDAAVASSIF